MIDEPAQRWRTTLRDALLAARKDRDITRVSALRSALAAIDNAETPDGVQLDAPSSGKIACGVVGLGAAEVARRQLSDTEIRELLRTEVDERLTAADQLTRGGYTERAETLRTEAAVLADLLGDANCCRLGVFECTSVCSSTACRRSKIGWRHNLIPVTGRDTPVVVQSGPRRCSSAVPAVALETVGQTSGYRWPGESA